MQTLNRLITIPTLDPDDARRRKLLNILLLGTAVSLLFADILSFIVIVTRDIKDWVNTGTGLIFLGSAVLFIGMVIIYFINKYRSGRVAAILFLILITIVVTFSDTSIEVSTGRSLFIFTIPIIMASVLLSPASSFIFSGLSSVIISAVASSIDRVPNIPAIGGYFVVALIAWLSARSLEQALRDLREINANLDRLVAQKTQELASALSREMIVAGRNQAILDSIADGVIVFDANNVAILANPALSHLTEMPLEILTKIELNDFIQTRQLSRSSQVIIMDLIEHPDKTVPGVRVEWGKKTLSTSIAPVQNISGESIGTVAVFRDITSEAEIEKMKETFVAIVSHELRTPLNAIMGHTEMLKEEIFGSLNEKQLSIAERIMVNVGRLLSMVGDLLDEAQIRAGKLSIKLEKFKTASLLDVLHNTMDKIAGDKGLYLTSELDPKMPERLTGDPQRLQQVLVNLVNNAVKFTEKGGVHVSITCAGPDRWKMEVTDTGLGIPEHEIPYIFDTFRQVDSVTTRQHGGFGLGLSIVKQLVELMDGEITVKSSNTSGSTFTILLPMEND